MFRLIKENPDEELVSFPYFVAFTLLLSNMELVKNVYLEAAGGARTKEISKGKKIEIQSS